MDLLSRRKFSPLQFKSALLLGVISSLRQWDLGKPARLINDTAGERPAGWSGWMLALGIACCACTAEHQTEESEMMELKLPSMFVRAVVDDLPWRYARSGEVEVLTLCSETMASTVTRAATRSRLYLPQDFQGHGSRPLRYILFDEAVAQYTPMPTQKVPILNARFEGESILFKNVLGRPSGISAANLFRVSSWLELDTGYASYYFDNGRPVGPDWLRAGLLGGQGAISELASYNKSVRMIPLAAFAWSQVTELKDMLVENDARNGLYPLVDLFESPPPDDPRLRRWWELQAALFCRWQIYSTEGQRNGGHGFWNWARLARKGPVDEADFKRCIGMDYAMAEKRMLKYLDRVLGVPMDVPIRLYPLEEELKLRPATEEEIARLLGAFQWQEAKRFRETNDWGQASKYESAARRTYERGLKRTRGHAALHAGLGLLEYEAGCAEEARAHLEKAMTGNGADARALLALSRLRFDEIRAKVGGDGKLDGEQIVFVLAPAFAARSETPVAVEIYRHIGAVWALSAFTPEAKYLNVLLEGVANYPHDLELAYQVAHLHAHFGYFEISRAVAQRAARLAGRSRHRERFESLLGGIAQP